VKIIF